MPDAFAGGVFSTETIVAPGTPAGESAIAVIRVSGPLAGEIALGLRGGVAPPPRRAWHGAYMSRNGVMIDDAVLCFFPAPGSYTGEDVLEVSCHGNPFIVRKIIDDCLSWGCRLADPGEFTRRAFLHGRLDLTEAEAVMDLIRARSDRALEAAHLQLRGALGRQIAEYVDRLLGICAAIEAYIDFPDEDLPGEDRAARGREVMALLDEMRRLQATRRQGDLLREGLSVVLLGEPNAGKSSLMNRIVGYERAIVSAEPGTTRDFLEESMLLGPHRIRMIDTAGLREADGGVERAGVTRTLARAEVADLFIVVVDAARPSPTLPPEVVVRLGAGNAVVAANKSDLGMRVFEGLSGLRLPVFSISALTGEGIDRMRAKLVELADEMTGMRGSAEHVAVNSRHAAALEECAGCLERAGVLIGNGAALELVGSELRGGVDALGQIVGRVDSEAMLDRLFSSFCIGK